MDLMCAWQTSGMPTFSHQHPKSITSSVDQFGMENVCKVAIMHRAVYGGKTSGRDFRSHLRSCMQFHNFTSCPAGPDVWMRPAIKSDGSKCYDYVLLYVDDALVVSENAEYVLRNELGRYFEQKEESIGPPDHYLGGKVRKVQLENGVYAWAFSSSQYVQTAVKNVEAYLMSEDSKCWKMPKKADTPFNRNMSKSKGWTLQGSLLMLWMDENASQQSNKNR